MQDNKKSTKGLKYQIDKLLPCTRNHLISLVAGISTSIISVLTNSGSINIHMQVSDISDSWTLLFLPHTSLYVLIQVSQS